MILVMIWGSTILQVANSFRRKKIEASDVVPGFSDRQGGVSKLGGGNSNIFYFHPYLWKSSNLTNIFQMGWNHQPEKNDRKQDISLAKTLQDVANPYILQLKVAASITGFASYIHNQLDHQLFQCQATTFSTTKETQYSRSELYCYWSRFGRVIFSVDRVSVGDEDIIYTQVFSSTGALFTAKRWQNLPSSIRGRFS